MPYLCRINFYRFSDPDQSCVRSVDGDVGVAVNKDSDAGSEDRENQNGPSHPNEIQYSTAGDCDSASGSVNRGQNGTSNNDSTGSANHRQNGNAVDGTDNSDGRCLDGGVAVNGGIGIEAGEGNNGDGAGDPEDGATNDSMPPNPPNVYFVPDDYLLRFEMDVDTISFVTQSPSSMTYFFPDDDAVFQFNSVLLRTNVDKSSRMRMVSNGLAGFQCSYGRNNVPSLPLNCYRNIYLGDILEHNRSFSLHMYYVGSGTTYPTNFFENTFLQTIACAMNIAASDWTLPSLNTDAYNQNNNNDDDDEHRAAKRLISLAQYKNECGALSFVVHDGTKESQALKNSKRKLSGSSGKLFLQCFQCALAKIVDLRDDEEALSQCVNMFTVLAGARDRHNLHVQQIVSIAEDIQKNSLYVAECTGIKNLLSNRPGRCFAKEDGASIDAWISLALTNVHETIVQMFGLDEEPYPKDAFHRIDYGLQIFPCSKKWGLCCGMSEAYQYCNSLLKVDRLSQKKDDRKHKQENTESWGK